jgi:hypothetical protein
MVLTPDTSPGDWYALLPNPVVAESLFARLINTSPQVATTVAPCSSRSSIAAATVASPKAVAQSAIPTLVVKMVLDFQLRVSRATVYRVLADETANGD